MAKLHPKRWIQINLESNARLAWRISSISEVVIRIALAHELLIILNAKARDARRDFANAT
jgi:hypothetical protein